MLVEIIESLELSNTKRLLYNKMAEHMDLFTPDSLTQTPYELETTSEIPAKQWNEFLRIKEINHYIEKEIAQLSEYQARSMLGKLARGELTGQDATAAQKFIENSRLLRQKHNPKATIVLTRIPRKRRGEEENVHPKP